MAITDSIQANKGLYVVSSMIILLQLTPVYLLCHQNEYGRQFWDYFFGFNSMSTVFHMYEGDVSWN